VTPPGVSKSMHVVYVVSLVYSMTQQLTEDDPNYGSKVNQTLVPGSFWTMMECSSGIAAAGLQSCHPLL